MSKNSETAIAAVMGSFGLIWLVVVIGVIVGWIMNIFDVIGVSTPLNAEDALHIVGIFIVPLGAIMGIFF